MEINQTVPRQVNAKTLSIYTKVCDNFCANLYDDQGKQICGQDDGYVLSFMPGDHFGDSIILDIDIDTGQITNWDSAKVAQKLQGWVDDRTEADMEASK